MSNLRHSLFQSESQTSDLSARISQLEASLATHQSENSSLQREIAALRDEQAAAAKPADEDPLARIKALTAALTTAQSRVATLEKKVETLNTLHRDSETRNSAQSTARSKEMERLRAEATDMRKKLQTKSHENARLRASSTSSSNHQRGLSSISGDEGNFEEQVLRKRIRELEQENFDLQRGVWQDRRNTLGVQGHGRGDETVFDDIDLSPPAVERMRRASPYGAFTNIINTFTGGGSSGGRRQSGPRQSFARNQQSRGFFESATPDGQGEGQDGFDDEEELELNEDAFKAAQEEESKKRLERVREVKRGLNEWKGWRVDIVDVRGGAMAGVFDI